MSAICQNFVQNAWKKELCSNCFKSKDEHNLFTPKIKPLPIKDVKSVESIIKDSNKKKSKHSVCFPAELSQVIGYGGEDWSETEDEVRNIEEVSDDDDDFPVDDDDPDLRKLTKANTDFNTLNANLASDPPEVKKSYTQLMLGKPQTDAEGRRQTLLVSVTPFGQDTTKKYSKSHIPIAKNNKDIVAETKTTVILTSYTNKNEDNISKEEKSLLDEISETLEKGKNPIQIMSRKKSHKDIILSVTKTESDSKNKENIEQESVKSKSNIPERKNGLSRTPVIKRDQEKPMIFQTSTAKIEFLNTKNLKLSESKENLALKLIKNNVKEGEDTIEGNGEKDGVQLVESKSSENLPEISDRKIEEHLEVGKELVSKNAHVDKSNNEEALKYENTEFPETREQAGEPDGRADSDDNNEPPALPLTAPPNLDSRTSFLHSLDKPKVPAKPATMIIRKSVLLASPSAPNILSTFVAEPKIVEQESTGPVKQDMDTRIGNKRRAPKPPPTDDANTIYSKNTMGSLNMDSPIVREKEKRERASSCSPKIRKIVSDPGQDISDSIPMPEPAPRRTISLSTDSLANCTEEKKKEKTRGRFSLKKFLRMGSSKDLQKLQSEIAKSDDIKEGAPLPKPRLVIVHPLELNGAKVEVVTKSFNTDHVDYVEYASRPVKPPPPPRNIDDWNTTKPYLPHPPKSAEIISKQKHYNAANGNSKKVDSVYANIGEVRSAITPNKPQRTASMREREALLEQQTRKTASNYEPINVQSKDTNENVYDYINGARSSSSEYDSTPEKNSPTAEKAISGNGLGQRRSDSSVDVSGDYYKYQNIPRSVSMTYCGSETESEIYSPYSFYGSESEITEDDDWGAHSGKTHKLRSRKGRSIVHKNLEDNYGAVVIANHEALAQVLEHIQHGPTVLPALRGLKTSTNMRWTEFTIKENVAPLIVGNRAFRQALWGAHHVTLAISAGSVPMNPPLALGTLSLVPITEFSDLVPVKYLHADAEEDIKHLQATVAVLPWMQINTIQTFRDTLKAKSAASSSEDTWKDASFILLQLVNALKSLQAQGIEELPLSLSSFVLCRESERESHFRLCVIQGLGEEMARKKEEDRFGSLCVCASEALKHLLPNSKLTSLIRSLLNNERAVSLTQVKSVLEFSLWGPSDVVLGSNIKDRELALQRWLDLQRATVLHGLVCTRVQLTVYEECHLLFLVRSNSKMMCDASLLLDSNNMQNREH